VIGKALQMRSKEEKASQTDAALVQENTDSSNEK
jgi:hypothetical protein